MTTKDQDTIRRKMRQLVKIANDLSTIAFNQNSQIDSAILYDAAQGCEDISRKIEIFAREEYLY